ncbi:MAG TPA: dienelactone hydrolase family protein [Caulobacteraceae bacterium]|jgi:carboxymethylenebutenolidase
MPNERWTIKTADGAFSAYVAKPSGPGPWPGLVVIQEIFGVNAVMRDTCDRFAAQGYLAVCPDLFWRIQPGIDITDHSEAEWKQAFGYYNAFDVDKGIEDIAATLAQTRAGADCGGRAGAVGYCLGGLLAYLTACRTDSDATAAYYGVGIENHLGEAEKLANPLLLQIAEEDGFVPKEAQARIKAALQNHPCVTLYSYPGRDHAFCRPGGQNFDQADADLANQRALAFFKRNLG